MAACAVPRPDHPHHPLRSGTPNRQAGRVMRSSGPCEPPPPGGRGRLCGSLTVLPLQTACSCSEGWQGRGQVHTTGADRSGAEPGPVGSGHLEGPGHHKSYRCHSTTARYEPTTPFSVARAATLRSDLRTRRRVAPIGAFATTRVQALRPSSHDHVTPRTWTTSPRWEGGRHSLPHTLQGWARSPRTAMESICAAGPAPIVHVTGGVGDGRLGFLPPAR